MHFISIRSVSSISITLLLFAGACGPADSSDDDPTPLEVSTRAAALSADNGRSLNGRSLNGRSLNGRSLNGRSLNGVSLGTAQIAGVAAGDVRLDGTAFVAGSGATAMRDFDFIGARLTGLVSDGSTLELRIDDIDVRTAQGADVYSYVVTYATEQGRQNICGASANGTPVQAIPLAGLWDYREGVAGGGAHLDDPNAFTFACVNTAMGKCVNFGYQPWRSASLAAHHQACTRMLRADYCGDGRSFTTDGRDVNIYDGIGIQADTERWQFEAEWTPTGARCVTQERVQQLQVNVLGLLALGLTNVPRCVSDRQAPLCALRPHFQGGSLIANEFRASALISLNLGL